MENHFSFQIHTPRDTIRIYRCNIRIYTWVYRCNTRVCTWVQKLDCSLWFLYSSIAFNTWVLTCKMHLSNPLSIQYSSIQSYTRVSNWHMIFNNFGNFKICLQLLIIIKTYRELTLHTQPLWQSQPHMIVLHFSNKWHRH